MNKVCNLILVIIILSITKQNCLAVDFDPTHAATSIAGAGDDNSAQVSAAISKAKISPNSKNVEVLYQNGSIVLRGTVDNDRDRQTIGNAAEQCGCVSIKNELTVRKSVNSVSKTKVLTPKAEILTPSH